MKELFPQYYQAYDARKPSGYDAIWHEAVFVFDTHVLLNIYSYPVRTRSSWLNTLTSVQKQLWVPYQIAEEYHLLLAGRKKQMENEQSEAFVSPLKKVMSMVDAVIKEQKERVLGDSPDVGAIYEELRAHVQELSVKMEEQFSSWKRDYSGEWLAIQNQLSDLFPLGQIGRPYTSEEIIEKCVEGKARYMTQTPPGYKDYGKVGKEGNPYGDVLAWFQIIDHAQAVRKAIVFVTADAKGDWFTDKTDNAQPRHELAQELMERPGVAFRLIKPPEFLEWAKRMLNQPADGKAVEETRAVTQKELEQLSLQELANMVPDDPAWMDIYCGSRVQTSNALQWLDRFYPVLSVSPAASSLAKHLGIESDVERLRAAAIQRIVANAR